MREIGDVNEYLVNGLRNQSHEVFEVIFKTYYPSLYRLAYAYLMNKNLAEDMVQDTFVSFGLPHPRCPLIPV